jgi:serine/threonine-protein phosphatase PGAM5
LRRAQCVSQVSDNIHYELVHDTYNDLFHQFRVVPEISYWNPDDHEFFVDGARIEAAFRNYIHRADPSQEKDSYTALVCHGNVIRYFVCRALQFPPEAWLRFNLHHASISYFVVHPNGRVVLRFFGDCGHMPKSHVTLS